MRERPRERHKPCANRGTGKQSLHDSAPAYPGNQLALGSWPAHAGMQADMYGNRKVTLSHTWTWTKFAWGNPNP